MEQMYFVTIGGVRYSYPAGTTFRKIAEDVQAQYASDILLVERDGKLCELCKTLDRDHSGQARNADLRAERYLFDAEILL